MPVVGNLQKPALVDHTEMTRFHTDDYVNFLRIVTPHNKHQYLRELRRCTCRRISPAHLAFT